MDSTPTANPGPLFFCSRPTRQLPPRVRCTLRHSPAASSRLFTLSSSLPPLLESAPTPCRSPFLSRTKRPTLAQCRQMRIQRQSMLRATLKSGQTAKQTLLEEALETWLMEAATLRNRCPKLQASQPRPQGTIDPSLTQYAGKATRPHTACLRKWCTVARKASTRKRSIGATPPVSFPGGRPFEW